MVGFYLVEEHEAPFSLSDGVDDLLRDLGTLAGEADHAVRGDKHPSLPKQPINVQPRRHAKAPRHACHGRESKKKKNIVGMMTDVT